MGRRVAVIGGGPSGAITAIALKRHGFEPTLYDKVDPFEEVKQAVQKGELVNIQFGETGGTLGILGNGVKALKNLGLLDYVKEFQEDPMVMELNFMYLDGSDRTCRRTLVEEGVQPMHALRSKLHQILVKAANAEGIKLYGGKKLKTLTQTADDVTVEFEDGTQIVADFVVGADGIHSKTRQLIFPDSAKPVLDATGYITIFDLGTYPDGSVVDFNHPEGIYNDPLNGRFIFTAPFGKNQGEAKIFEMNVKKPLDQADDWRPVSDLPKEAAQLADTLQSWGTEPAIVNCVRHAKRITPVNLYDLPDLPSFYKGRVVLVGDAAHGTVPYAAQGLCQAIEDCGTLADLWGHYQDDYEKAFSMYDKIRVPRTRKVVSLARTTGSRLRASNVVQMKFGRFMMKLVFSLMEWFGVEDEITLHNYRDDIRKVIPDIQFQ
ncbi:hypothetical protein HDU79_005788 [Rhizoclosmatium sp. JEL0117]|nr:hypothetical protein HDU79_005788 [Rhizoclosmatium sp. JEL0117]